MPDKVFRVHLVAHGALPAGAPLVTGGGLDARVQELSDGATGLLLTVAADWSRPLVELRWLVDQVVRRVRRLYDMRGARAQLEGEVTAVVRTAIALDLRRAFPTQRESLALDGAELYRDDLQQVPSLIGLSMPAALELAAERGLELAVTGSGIVVGQQAQWQDGRLVVHVHFADGRGIRTP